MCVCLCMFLCEYFHLNSSLISCTSFKGDIGGQRRLWRDELFLLSQSKDKALEISDPDNTYVMPVFEVVKSG